MSFLTTLLQGKCIELNENNLSGAIRIRSQLLYNSSYITKAHFPSTVTEIEDVAFYKCSSLSDVHFSEGLKSIGNSTFAGCSSLTKISLPSTLENIGDSAFGHPTMDSNQDWLEEIEGLDTLNPSVIIWRGSFGSYSPWFLSHTGAVLVSQGRLLLGYVNEFEPIPETVTHLAKEFMGSIEWTKQPSTLIIPDSVQRLPVIWGTWSFTNSICKKVVVGTGVSEMMSGSMQIVGDTVWVCKQPANLQLSLPEKGLAYNKQAATMTLYTDNLSLKQYNWSADNVTATIRPLSEAPED